MGFFLRSEGRGVLTLAAAADLRERISQVHGLSLARSIIALEDPVVWGFVSPLAVSFPTRRYLHVAVNGRVVDTDSFAPAISKAYVDLLPKGRHPDIPMLTADVESLSPSPVVGEHVDECSKDLSA